jgi:hypothetical protein
MIQHYNLHKIVTKCLCSRSSQYRHTVYKPRHSYLQRFNQIMQHSKLLFQVIPAEYSHILVTNILAQNRMRGHWWARSISLPSSSAQRSPELCGCTLACSRWTCGQLLSLQVNSGLDHTAATANGTKLRLVQRNHNQYSCLMSSLIGKKTTGFACNISHISKICIG